MVAPAPSPPTTCTPLPLPRRCRRDGQRWEGSPSEPSSAATARASPPPRTRVATGPPPPARRVPLARASPPGIFPRARARCFVPGFHKARVRGRGGFGPVLGFSGGLTERKNCFGVDFFPGRGTNVDQATFPAGLGVTEQGPNGSPFENPPRNPHLTPPH
jgi:hypothetical protein